jgi:hypothetical protein
MKNLTLEEFLIGTLLGDGCIGKLDKNAKNYKWSCTHSEKQYDYLKWKVEFLIKYNLHSGNITKYISNNKRYLKPCVQYTTKSKSITIFSEYRKLFYINGKKIFPENIKITPNILTILYMDDGHLLKVKGKTPKAIFNLHSFSNECRDRFCQQLKDLGLVATSRHNNGEVAISAYSMDKFREIVKPLELFNYKMGPCKTLLNRESLEVDNPVLS